MSGLVIEASTRKEQLKRKDQEVDPNKASTMGRRAKRKKRVFRGRCDRILLFSFFFSSFPYVFFLLSLCVTHTDEIGKSVSGHPDVFV